jgi:RimJ/RimL family protein N-acetyltransferase
MAWFLESARLRFRRYERGDIDFLAGLCADPDVMRYIGDGMVLDRAATAARLEKWLEHPPDRGFFLAVKKADATPVGHAALILQTIAGQAEPEVGWWLARAAWHQGYAAEAGAAFRDYAFAVAGFDRIIHLIQPANERSAAVARRIGSTFERVTSFRGHPVHVYGQRRNFERTT